MGETKPKASLMSPTAPLFGQMDCPFCPNGGPDPDTGARVHVANGELTLVCDHCGCVVQKLGVLVKKPRIEVVAAYPELCRELYGTGEIDAAVTELNDARLDGDAKRQEAARAKYEKAVTAAKKEMEDAA